MERLGEITRGGGGGGGSIQERVPITVYGIENMVLP